MGKAHNDMLTVKKSKFGQGLFATKDILKGTIFFIVSGRQIHFDEAKMLGEIESYPIQTSIDSYVLPDFPIYLSNHSCDPNCGINENLEFIAIKKIKEGDEILWDYSTSMLERHWTMSCECGSPLCRQIIADFDQLAKEIQEKYIKLKIVQPFIKNYLKQ